MFHVSYLKSEIVFVLARFGLFLFRFGCCFLNFFRFPEILPTNEEISQAFIEVSKNYLQNFTCSLKCNMFLYFSRVHVGHQNMVNGLQKNLPWGR